MERKIIILNFLNQGPLLNYKKRISGLNFSFCELSIGWNFEIAEKTIRSYDGFVDGFAIRGVPKSIGIGKDKLTHAGYLRLIRVAVKTPIYFGDEVQNIFYDWSLTSIIREYPGIFKGKKVLFQCALASPFLQRIKDQGATILAADPLLLSGVRLRLVGIQSISFFFRMLKPVMATILFRWIEPGQSLNSKKSADKLTEWIQEADIFVGFNALLKDFPTPAVFKDKVVILDELSPILREQLGSLPGTVLELLPSIPPLQDSTPHSFSVLNAVLDQIRICQNSPLRCEEFYLQWLNENEIRPPAFRNLGLVRRKCAFVIHPMESDDFWKAPALKNFKSQRIPKFVRGVIENNLKYLNVIKVGSITDIRSPSTGRIVDCDFYAILATPKQLLAMPAEVLYKKLTQCSHLAASKGASIMGLGAYTKVAGDAGVTVSQRSSIPVTNGNSYSASTTLWAAREMVEKMALISPLGKIGKRYNAKVAVIGATGSIGRVSSLLVSLVFQEITLVANRPDKLLELKEEIRKLSPSIRVNVSTHASADLSTSDLVVIATSNPNGNLLDIMKLKPGAVVCDCSRPFNITPEEAERRPDILVIESGEVLLPGQPVVSIDVGLPYPSVHACTAETILLAMEGRFESFSLSKHLSTQKVKDIYKLGVKHGFKLSEIRGPLGTITQEQINNCRNLALKKLSEQGLYAVQ